MFYCNILSNFLSGDNKEIHTNIFKVPSLFTEIAVSGLYESAVYCYVRVLQSLRN
jgi:hypothetical protein